MIVAAHGVWQTGVRVSKDPAIRAFRQIVNVRNHILSTQGAIQTNRDRFRVRNGVPKRLVRLTGQSTARVIDDGTGNENRDFLSPVFEVLVHRKQSRFGVQRIKDSFHQKNIHATFNQRLRLLVIRFDNLIKSTRAKRRVLHRRTHRQRTIRRANSTSRKSRLRRILLRELNAAFFGQLRRRDVDVPNVLFPIQSVIRLRNHSRVESVRLDNISTSRQVRRVNLLDNIRSSQNQNIVVAFQIVLVVFVPLRTEILLLQLVRLNGRSHRAVDDHDPLRHDFIDNRKRVRLGKWIHPLLVRRNRAQPARLCRNLWILLLVRHLRLGVDRFFPVSQVHRFQSVRT